MQIKEAIELAIKGKMENKKIKNLSREELTNFLAKSRVRKISKFAEETKKSKS